MAGPLSGIRIIGFAGTGPRPSCGLMLAGHCAGGVRRPPPRGGSPRGPGGRRCRGGCYG